MQRVTMSHKHLRERAVDSNVHVSTYLSTSCRILAHFLVYMLDIGILAAIRLYILVETCICIYNKYIYIYFQHFAVRELKRDSAQP